MRRWWFPAQPVEESFFDSSPVRLLETFDIPLPAARVWGDLTSENPLSWCRFLGAVTWTSPQPFGVGTKRTACTAANTNVINERFFRWEEGRRHSFYVVESNIPLFRRWAEDYLVEPTAQDACRLTWTIAYEPRLLARPANPVNRVLLTTLFSDTRRYYGLR